MDQETAVRAAQSFPSTFSNFLKSRRQFGSFRFLLSDKICVSFDESNVNKKFQFVKY